MAAEQCYDENSPRRADSGRQISGAATFSELRLSDANKDWLNRHLRAFPQPDASTPHLHRVELLRTILQLDDELLGPLLEFGRDPAAPSGLLIRNVPLGAALPKTPTGSAKCTGKPDAITENFAVALGLLLGEPVAFSMEKEGELVPDIVPVYHNADSVSNEGYRVALKPHSDLAHLGLHAPAFVILLCLRGDPRGEAVTYHIDARDVLPLLDAADLAALREPHYRIEIPASFKAAAATGEQLLSAPLPLLSGPDFAPQLVAEFNSTYPLGDRAARALRALESACMQPGVAHEIRLQDGDCLLTRNRAALHGRSPYRPRFSGRQRWLQRLYVAADLWPSRHAMGVSYRVLNGAFL
jgi:L-asparagine oxygenase